MSLPQSSLFEVISMNFICPFPEKNQDNRYNLVTLEHLASQSIVACTRRSTAEVVITFMESQFIEPFGAPGGDYEWKCHLLQSENPTKVRGEDLGIVETVLAYAPMSNGRAERMFRTIRRGSQKTFEDVGAACDTVVDKVFFGYCKRLMCSDVSSFDLLYEFKPRTIPKNDCYKDGTDIRGDRGNEFLKFLGIRTTRAF